MNTGRKILAGVGAAAMVGGAALLLPPAAAGPRMLRFDWDVPESPLSNALEFVVQSRTDLAAGAWVTFTNLPYRAGTNSFRVAMNKPAEFFRVGWRFKK